MKGTRPTRCAPSVGVLTRLGLTGHHTRRWGRGGAGGTRIPDCILGVWEKNSDLGVRIIRLGNESEAGAAGRAA